MEDKGFNFDIMRFMAMAFQIASELEQADIQFESGQPTSLPPIRTYVGSTHVEIDITAKKLA